MADMSLYYDAATLLDNRSHQSGSIKSRVFGSNNLKSKPSQLFALLVEATKWSEILSEVVQKADVLRQEKKV